MQAQFAPVVHVVNYIEFNHVTVLILYPLIESFLIRKLENFENFLDSLGDASIQRLKLNRKTLTS